MLPNLSDASRRACAGRHAGAQIVVDVHLEVGFQLLAQLALTRFPAPPSAQAHQQAAQLSHDSFSTARNRAIMVAVSSHSRASLRRWPWPARVSL